MTLREAVSYTHLYNQSGWNSLDPQHGAHDRGVVKADAGFFFEYLLNVRDVFQGNVFRKLVIVINGGCHIIKYLFHFFQFIPAAFCYLIAETDYW